jgi:hypothetical protein
MVSKAKKRVEFAIEEIILSFVGAFVLTLGITFTIEGGWNFFLLGVFSIWLGLLLFVMPMVRKIEVLM